MRDSSAHQHSLLFTTFFCAAYFLTLIFSEKFAFLWIAPLFITIYSWAFWKMFDKHTPIRNQSAVLALTLSGILALLLLLTPLSQKIPSSILRWASLAVAGLTLLFFSATPIVQKIRLPQFLTALIGLHAVVLFVHILLLFFPEVQSALPFMSVLGFTGGHNHAYILYLISVPLCLYNFQRRQGKKWLFLSAFFILGVILSFSRVGMLLVGSELIIFGFWLRRQMNHNAQLLLGGLAAALFLILAAFIFFTIQPQLSFGTNCQLPLFHTQLCKSIDADHRMTYWKEALQGIAASPWLGTGGNTFDTVSLRYRPSIDAFSVYPHNEYLQLVVEYGVIGLFIVCLYLGGLIYGLTRWKHLSRQTKLFLLISWVLAVDAVLNFNWNFTGLLLAILLILALYLSGLLQDIRAKTKLLQLRVLLLPFTLIALPLFGLSVLFISSELLRPQLPYLSATLFPFQLQTALHLVLQSETPAPLREQLRLLYAKDATVLQLDADQEVDLQKQYAKYLRLEQLDPQNERVRLRVLALAIETHDPKKVLQTVLWLRNIFRGSNSYTLRTIDDHYLEKIIVYSNQLAASDPQLASEIAILAYQIEPWRVNELQTYFLLNPDHYSDDLVLQVLHAQTPYTLWSYLPSLNSWTWEKMRVAGENDQWNDFLLYTKVLLLYSDWDPRVIWTYQSELIRIKVDHLSPTEKSAAQRRQLLSVWQESLETIQKFGKVGDTPIDTTGWDRQLQEYGLAKVE